MTIVLIQVLLIVGVAAVAVRLLTSTGPRSQAVRRIGLLLFAALAIFSILVPQSWSALAAVVGVGRGTDLILYALVVAFLSFTASTYLRYRRLEANLTQLARRLALDEARPPSASRSNEQRGDTSPPNEDE